MGNPYLRKRGAKSVSVRPFQQSGRDMSFLPVPLTTLDGGELLFQLIIQKTLLCGKIT